MPRHSSPQHTPTIVIGPRAWAPSRSVAGVWASSPKASARNRRWWCRRRWPTRAPSRSRSGTAGRGGRCVAGSIDGGDNAQEAIERSRFNVLGGERVALESALAAAIGADLARRGHVVEDESAALLAGGFGGAQAIAIDPDRGAYWGGSDPRKDGCAIGF
ncbi:gamma-glutamyltransferase [bacterium]|nr:gamma-glutamyltransferase [bacterium]